MMRRSTLAILVIFILAVVALLLLQNAPNSPLSPTATPVSTTAPALLAGVNPQDINLLVYKQPTGVETRLTRGPDGSWQYGEAGAVAPGKVEQLIAELLATRTILQMPLGQNLKDILLENPTQSITFQTAGGKTTIIQIGGLTPTQSGYYVKVDQNAAAVIEKAALETMFQLFNESKPATPTPGPGTAEPTITPKP
jgi:hypothetical protein